MLYGKVCLCFCMFACVCVHACVRARGTSVGLGLGHRGAAVAVIRHWAASQCCACMLTTAEWPPTQTLLPTTFYITWPRSAVTRTSRGMPIALPAFRTWCASSSSGSESKHIFSVSSRLLIFANQHNTIRFHFWSAHGRRRHLRVSCNGHAFCRLWRARFITAGATYWLWLEVHAAPDGDTITPTSLMAGVCACARRHARDHSHGWLYTLPPCTTAFLGGPAAKR